MVERVPVQPVGAEAEGSAEQAADRAVPAGQRLERVGGEVHGEQGERGPRQPVRGGARPRRETGQAQVRDRGQPGIRGRDREEGGAHRRTPGERRDEPDHVEGARRIEGGRRQHPGEHDRDRRGDERGVEPAHERHDSARMDRGERLGLGDGPTMPPTAGCDPVHRMESRCEPQVE